MYIDLYVKYPLFLSDFNEICTFSKDFRKILKLQFLWKSFQLKPSWSMRTEEETDGQTDMTKLLVAFRNFANAPKISFCNYLLYLTKLSLAQDVPCRTMWWSVKTESEKVWQEAVVVAFAVLCRYIPGGTKTNHKNLSQNGLFWGWYPNQGPLE
jgi:hypothetical protein